jgi:hypothetical protein
MRIDLNQCFPLGEGVSQGPLPKQQQFMDAAFNEKGPAYVLYSGGV